jgi:hypothetical protein
LLAFLALWLPMRADIPHATSLHSVRGATGVERAQAAWRHLLDQETNKRFTRRRASPALSAAEREASGWHRDAGAVTLSSERLRDSKQHSKNAKENAECFGACCLDTPSEQGDKRPE